MLENRIGRLQDDLQDTVNLSQAGGGGNGSGTENVALMIRHKKAKPVNIIIIFIFSSKKCDFKFGGFHKPRRQGWGRFAKYLLY